MTLRFIAACFLSFGLAFTFADNNVTGSVKLSVYYESLCSDSRDFVVGQMYPVWQDLKDILIMDINVYGKINETEDGDAFDFKCQHGPEECKGNLMLNCAKKYLEEEEYLAFSNCTMGKFVGTKAGAECAETLELDYGAIFTCWTDVEGEELLHDVGEVQDELEPPLDYVPWILINDVYTLEQRKACEKDLRKVICDAYEGEKPEKCNE